jgi:hypothetical protein
MDRADDEVARDAAADDPSRRRRCRARNVRESRSVWVSAKAVSVRDELLTREASLIQRRQALEAHTTEIVFPQGVLREIRTVLQELRTESPEQAKAIVRLLVHRGEEPRLDPVHLPPLQ